MKTRSPMAGLAPPGHRDRRRRERRRHRRRAVGVILAIVPIVAAGVAAWFLLGGDIGRSFKGGSAPERPSTLLALAVLGRTPLVAVVAAQGSPHPSAVTVPDEVTFVLPGQGEGTAGDAASLSGRSFRVAISNMLGAWTHHYLVMTREGFAGLVDRMGGIEVDLEDSFEVEGETYGPGPETLDGAVVRRFLEIEGENLDFRWDLVVDGLLEQGSVPLLQNDAVHTDDIVASAGLLEAASGAAVQPLPTERLGLMFVQPDPADMPELVRSLYGVSGNPVPVIVTNGAGIPGVGEAVAEKLIPAGFRIVLSDNAEHFGAQQTKVIASDEDRFPLAQRAQEELGVGTVAVSQVPSGFADVTIVVGKDFHSG